MLQLRLDRGVRYDDVRAVSGIDARAVYADVLLRLAQLGLIEGDQCGFRLTDSGINVADAVAAELMAMSQ
jgi:coproporphyrinogen III oxidase-like Fe-S oxidoreductase